MEADIIAWGIYGIVIVIALVFSSIKLRSSRVVDVPDTPYLLARGTNGELIGNAGGVTPHGLNFNYLLSDSTLFSDAPTVGVYTVELSFCSAAHLIGIPRADKLLPPVGIMETVELEGDYAKYFALYADIGEQVESRYVLDPAAMSFTVEFCRQFCWEVADDTLYFLSQGQLPSLALIDEFVEQIRPAIELKSERDTNPNKLPYVLPAARKILCPICRLPLAEGRCWLECPAGHGQLVTGSQLAELHEEKVLDEKADQSMHPLIKCPYCSHDMNQTRYQYTDMVIDVCTACRYRWLDGGQLDTLKSVTNKE